MEAAVKQTLKGTLSAHGLTKSFGERKVLDGVTFTAHQGELVAIVGPNGAGKTTLLSILAGAVDPSAGSLTVESGGIGWVPQEIAIYTKLSVKENLRLFAHLEQVADVEVTVERMLDQTGLRERANDRVETLSGGNQQRVNIAVGLLSNPAVLLLDEPSAALDPVQRNRLWGFIGELKQSGTTVIYSTHYIQEASQHADRLLVIAGGKLLYNGSVAEFRAVVGDFESDFEEQFVDFLIEAQEQQSP